MTLQSLSLSAIEASGANPRRKFDGKAIEGLAASIRTDGLLHNLVVAPVEGKRNRFRIVSGERRFRAMKLLEQRGELPEDFSVPVEIRSKLSKDDTLRIATVENLQRQNLAPLEEAAALTKLVHKGAALDDVVAQTGLSATTIRRRIALNNLYKEAKAALASGEISLSHAEALTLGSAEQQREILPRIERCGYSGDDIKDILLDDRPTVAMAIFPVEQYTGTITTDLFAEDEASYFDDAEQFRALQEGAVAQLVKHHEQSAAWVEVTNEYVIPVWQYRRASKRQKGGVLINLAPSGHVEIREGLIRLKLDKDTAAATAENPIAPPKPKAAYSAPLCRLIGWHKSMALQELLLADPRKAKEVAIIDRLEELRIHECIRALGDDPAPSPSYRVMEEQARLVAAWLGLDASNDRSIWSAFDSPDELVVYEALRGLSDHELDMVLTFLTALGFGQLWCHALDTGDSLFNRVARDLSADMRNHWRPGRAFFEKRSRDQLLSIAQDCGLADLYGIGSLLTYKKSELVGCMLRHFDNAHAAAEPNAAQIKARQWLPEAMLFPAIDPGAAADDSQETPDDDTDLDEAA